jgi:hypothetical protein
MRRVTPWIVIALASFALWRLIAQRDIRHEAGVLAAGEPAQRLIEGAPVRRGAFTLRPRAQFSATVRVLRREEYALDWLAPLVPTDFAVGWGAMSDSAVLDRIEISQAHRFYFWRTHTWPVSRQVIERHSANWHVIAGSDAVRATLDRLRAGSIVELEGQLVDIEGRDAGMSTSLSRRDTGAGACEILLASSAKVLE